MLDNSFDTNIFGDRYDLCIAKGFVCGDIWYVWKGFWVDGSGGLDSEA